MLWSKCCTTKHHRQVGEADIVIDKNTNAFIQKYLDNIRTKMVPSHNMFRKRLFLTHIINEYRKISQTIQEVASSYGYHVPNATLNRKVTATSLRENLPTHDALPVHRHMSHTPEMSMRNYQYPDLHDSVDTYNTIKLLQSKKYLSEEEDGITLKEWPVTNDTTPSLKCCRAIIAKHKLERTGVQDRWKNLYKIVYTNKLGCIYDNIIQHTPYLTSYPTINSYSLCILKEIAEVTILKSI